MTKIELVDKKYFAKLKYYFNMQTSTRNTKLRRKTNKTNKTREIIYFISRLNMALQKQNQIAKINTS